MSLLLPILVFGLVLVGLLYVLRRSQRTVTRLNRHEIVAISAPSSAMAQSRTSILTETPRTGAIGKLAAKATSSQVRSKAAERLRQAGDPMPLGTFLLLRACSTFVLAPLGIFYVYRQQGLTIRSLLFMAVVGLVFLSLPSTYLKRKIRKRTVEIDRALPDALDLLVVCVEGGLSLDGGLQQVAQRTEGLLAAELQRLLGEISTGMTRREALQALAGRSASQSLGALCTTIIQADKMGVSIAETLRTLAETLRTKRRQKAETQARKAPIKMLPFLAFFMLPSLFIIILGPVAIAIMQMFHAMGA